MIKIDVEVLQYRRTGWRLRSVTLELLLKLDYIRRCGFILHFVVISEQDGLAAYAGIPFCKTGSVVDGHYKSIAAIILDGLLLKWSGSCIRDQLQHSLLYFLDGFSFCHRFDLRRSPLRTRWIVRASLSGFTILNTRCPSFGSFTSAMPAFYLIRGYYKIRSGVPPQKWRWAPLLREVEVFSHFWIWYCRI